jgi:transposase
MPYSLDLKEKVIAYIENGGRVSSAAKVFGINRASIYRWLGQTNLAPIKVERRKRKLDWKALEEDVKKYPDLRLCDRAKKFGVRISSIGYALKKLKITRKKKSLDTKREIGKKGLNTIDC